MRVAFITVGDPNRMTGGYLYHARLFAGLRARGLVVDEIVASTDPSPSGQQRASATLGTQLSAIQRADVLLVDALARIVIAPWLETCQAARPLVALVHELPSVAGGVATEEERAAEDRLLHADALIAVSGHGRDILLARGIAAERIAVVPPGCDRLRSLPHDVPAPLTPPHALCVAQWIPRKGILTLVEAWNLLTPRETRLLLIGETDADPHYATEVHAAIARGRGLDVLGVVDDARLAATYRQASLFVLPSRYEGYGMVYAEALLHGLPVIACDVGPVPELLGSDAALLVPPDDPPALARALDRVLHDDVLRERMARAALRRGQGLPTWDDTVTRVEAVLRHAIAQRAAR
jgi:glycosyltransferase involved in cell wall biosynthesis